MCFKNVKEKGEKLVSIDLLSVEFLINISGKKPE